MSITDKATEIKNLIQLLITLLPMIFDLIKEIVICIKELKTV